MTTERQPDLRETTGEKTDDDDKDENEDERKKMSRLTAQQP